jgi:hypothetical protein
MSLDILYVGLLITLCGCAWTSWRIGYMQGVRYGSEAMFDKMCELGDTDTKSGDITIVVEAGEQ